MSLPVLIRTAGRRSPAKNASSRERARPAWTSTRSGPGTPSTATPCCPCAPRPCSPSPPRSRPSPHRRPPRAPPASPQPGATPGNSPPAPVTSRPETNPAWSRSASPRAPPAGPPGHRAHGRRRPPARLRLVTMAPPPPGPRPMAPLPRPAHSRPGHLNSADRKEARDVTNRDCSTGRRILSSGSTRHGGSRVGPQHLFLTRRRIEGESVGLVHSDRP